MNFLILVFALFTFHYTLFAFISFQEKRGGLNEFTDFKTTQTLKRKILTLNLRCVKLIINLYEFAVVKLNLKNKSIISASSS